MTMSGRRSVLAHLGESCISPLAGQHSIRQVSSDEVDNDLQHTVVPDGVASQVNGLLAGVQDVSQGLVPSAELTLR